LCGGSTSRAVLLYGKPLGQNGENKFLIFDFDFLPAEHLLLYR
jgi:hypothetical protein